MKLGPHAGRAGLWLFILSACALVIASAELVITLSLADPSEGANIGAGVAGLAAIMAAVAVVLAAVCSRIRSDFGRTTLAVVAWFVSFNAFGSALIVARGIVEEIAGS